MIRHGDTTFVKCDRCRVHVDLTDHDTEQCRNIAADRAMKEAADNT